MKKTLPFLLLITLLVSCKSEKKEPESKPEPLVNTNFIKTFEGRIQNKFDYYAKLKSNNGEISGFYFYTWYCEKIPVQGTIDSVGNMKLGEYGNDNKLSGIFSGKMISDTKIEGNWSESENSKELPFYFIETNESFETALENCLEKKKTRVLKNLVIDKIELLEFEPTKTNGASWDNSLGNYKPDIYLLVWDSNEKHIYKQNIAHKDVTAEQLPLVFEWPADGEAGLRFDFVDFREGFTINFYDEDSITNHDLVASIHINTFEDHYDSKKQTQEMDIVGGKMRMTYHYE